MAKTNKGVTVEPNNSTGKLMTAVDDDRMFSLYVARVGNADLIHTYRHDRKVIFREAFAEARDALDVFASEIKQEA